MGKDEDLYSAATTNDVAAIRRLVAPKLWGTSANVNCTPYKDGATPLYVAAFNGHIDAVRALLGAGANVDAPTQTGATSLYIAAEKGHVDAVRALLGARANVDAPLQNGATPLYIAAQKGHVDAVRALLGAGANVDAPMQGGATPLYVAACNGHIDAVRALLEARANVDAPMQDGATPLFIAAQEGHVDAVRALLEARANVDAPTPDGATPLYIAARNGHVDAVRALLGARANVDALMQDGATPLYIAAYQGQVDAVRALLGAGANVNAQNQTGETPLFIAARNGHVDAVRALLEAKANVDAPTQTGATPLFIAVWNGHVDAVRALLGAGANVDAPTQGGWTPLQIAAAEGHLDAVQALLGAGADFKSKGEDGRTALDLVCVNVQDAQQRAAKTVAIKEALLAAADQRSEAAAPSTTRPTTTAPAPAAPASPPLYTGGEITLPSSLVSPQAQSAVQALVQSGFQAAVQVAGGIITCNPIALVAAPLELLRTVQAAFQDGAYCQERFQRVMARIAAMEPALRQLGLELRPPMRSGVSPNVVQSLCESALMLAQVLLALKDLEQKLRRKGTGLLRRSMELLRAGGYREQLDGLEAELRDCLSQLSTVLNIAHFTQVAEALRARQELQVATWPQQNEADRARDMRQLEGLMVEAVGGVRELQKQLVDQQLVLDGQVVGLQQVAEWLQRMHAGNGLIVQHLQQLDKRLQVMHLDVNAVKDQLAQQTALLVDIFAGQQSRKRVPMDSLPDLALPRERIQVDNVAEALADAKQGAFGGVVEAQWGRSKVAVKVYNYKGLSPGDCTEAVTEAVLLSKANHPNIVHCYGVVYDPDTAANDSIQGSLVLEWVGGGNLSDWLQDNPQRGLGLKGRLLLALSVTEGMQHLHEKKLVHGDLKPQNILMCSKRAPAGHVVPQVKICDFGLSVYTSSTLTQAGRPTPRHTQAYTLAYTSPERTRTFEPSREDDVYAFGILLYFIATGRTPFLRIQRHLLKEAIQSNTRPKIDEWLVGQAPHGPEREVAERYCELAKQCWAAEARDRPTFDDVHGRLSAMLQRLGS